MTETEIAFDTGRRDGMHEALMIVSGMVNKSQTYATCAALSDAYTRIVERLHRKDENGKTRKTSQSAPGRTGVPGDAAQSRGGDTDLDSGSGRGIAEGRR